MYLSTSSIASTVVTSVAASVTAVTLLSANSNVKTRMIYNDSTSNLYVKHGAAASTTSFTVMVSPGDMYEFPYTILYAGLVTGVWVSAVGAARITEG